MRLKTQVWKIGVLFIFIAIVLKILSSFGYILSIQSYLNQSLITLFFGSGLILCYIYIMIISTMGLRIISSLCFGILMFTLSGEIINTNTELIENEQHQIIVQTSGNSIGTSILTQETVVIRNISFYESKGGFFSKKLGSYIFIEDNPYHYIIENNQLIIFHGLDPSNSTFVINLN